MQPSDHRGLRGGGDGGRRAFGTLQEPVFGDHFPAASGGTAAGRALWPDPPFSDQGGGRERSRPEPDVGDSGRPAFIPLSPAGQAAAQRYPDRLRQRLCQGAEGGSEGNPPRYVGFPQRGALGAFGVQAAQGGFKGADQGERPLCVLGKPGRAHQGGGGPQAGRFLDL